MQKNQRAPLGHHAVVLLLMSFPLLVELFMVFRGAQRETSEQRAFIAHHPEYGLKGRLSSLRLRQFTHLGDDVYLDYAKAALYQTEQVSSTADALRRALRCSAISSAKCATEWQEALKLTKAHACKLLGLKKDEYELLFAGSYSEAISTIIAMLPWSSGSTLLWASDERLPDIDSVVSHRAEIVHLPSHYFRNAGNDFARNNSEPSMGSAETNTASSLLVVTAESSATGEKYQPEALFGFELNENGASARWHILLDARAFCATNALSPEDKNVSFIILSPQHLFGLPESGNIIMVHKRALELFESNCNVTRHTMCRTHLYEQQAISSIAAISAGLAAVNRIGISNIQRHVCSLSLRSASAASKLQHANGAPMIVMRGEDPFNCTMQSGILNFSILDARGHMLGCEDVRNGFDGSRFVFLFECHQNADFYPENAEIPVCTREESPDYASLRISYGYPTTLYEIDAFWAFIKATFHDSDK